MLSASNATGQIIANCRTWAGRAADEHPAEISSSGVDAQDFHDGTPLTLPKCGSPILRRRSGGGSGNKDQSDGKAVHVLRLQAGGNKLMVCLIRFLAWDRALRPF
jgi:hypothetical protein